MTEAQPIEAPDLPPSPLTPLEDPEGMDNSYGHPGTTVPSNSNDDDITMNTGDIQDEHPEHSPQLNPGLLRASSLPL